MARQASKKESTEAAVDQAARTFDQGQAAAGALSTALESKRTAVVVGMPDDALEVAWSGVADDWKEIRSDKDMSTEDRVAHVSASVRAFLTVATEFEGPGADALRQAARLADKVNTYRVKAIRLLAKAGADRHQIADVTGLTLHRASQYVAAASLVAQTHGTPVRLTEGQAEKIVSAGNVKAARAAIKAGDADGLAACHTPAPEAAPEDPETAPETVSAAMVLESAAADFLEAVRAGGNLAPEDLTVLDSACAKAAKALEVLQARRASVRAVAAATSAA